MSAGAGIASIAAHFVFFRRASCSNNYRFILSPCLSCVVGYLQCVKWMGQKNKDNFEEYRDREGAIFQQPPTQPNTQNTGHAPLPPATPPQKQRSEWGNERAAPTTDPPFPPNPQCFSAPPLPLPLLSPTPVALEQ
jgi:hypothetical protein